MRRFITIVSLLSLLGFPSAYGREYCQYPVFDAKSELEPPQIISRIEAARESGIEGLLNEDCDCREEAFDIDRDVQLHRRIANIPYVPDQRNYGVLDYWASVSETRKNGGDCEDSAIVAMAMRYALGYEPFLLNMAVPVDGEFDETVESDTTCGTGFDGHAVCIYFEGGRWKTDGIGYRDFNPEGFGTFEETVEALGWKKGEVIRFDMQDPRVYSSYSGLRNLGEVIYTVNLR